MKKGDVEGKPVVRYGDEDATFERSCPKCGRMVVADESIGFNGDGQPGKKPNATCSKCGRVEMPFMGYI